MRLQRIGHASYCQIACGALLDLPCQVLGVVSQDGTERLILCRNLDRKVRPCTWVTKS